ncbi:MAG: GreA/GreB family elongation factor, partial [Bacteroidetes bacterium]|nr:GreA/GreB family elongation factor [Bacteroidota bacterium]
SVKSPIGKGLLGKKIGEVALVQAPAGSIEFEILDIGL